MTKQLIKDAIKEMIRDGEISIEHDLHTTHADYDSFGNVTGAIDGIELESWLEVNDEDE